MDDDLFPDLVNPPQGLWDAKKPMPFQGVKFDGVVYDEVKDFDRLTGQLKRVHEALSGERWRTVGEIQECIRRQENIVDPECSISAQIRNLRKKRFGGWIIERRRRGGEDSAIWEYKIVTK